MDAATAQPDPELEPLRDALHRFRAAVSQHLMEALLELDLTMPQLRALKAIHEIGRASGRQLARELRVSPASIVPLCDRLEQQGYIERVRDTDDRRICWFRLTPKGTDSIEGLAAIGRSRILPALAKLSPADREFLVRVLDALTASITANAAEPDGPEAAAAAARRPGGRRRRDG